MTNEQKKERGLEKEERLKCCHNCINLYYPSDVCGNSFPCCRIGDVGIDSHFIYKYNYWCDDFINKWLKEDKQ